MINLLQGLVEEEVREILKSKGYSLSQETDADTLDSVFAAAYAIHRNVHTRATDYLIEQCDSAFRYKLPSFLTSKNQPFPTNDAIQLFMASFSSLGTPRASIQEFQTKQGRISFLSRIGKELKSWQSDLPVTERKSLCRKLAKDSTISAIIERGESDLFELLTRVLYHPSFCLKIFLSYQENSLETLLTNHLRIPTEKLQDAYLMSRIITQAYVKKRNIPHRTFLLQLLPYFEIRAGILLPAPSDYATHLFGKKSISDYFTDKEIQSLFDGDSTLDTCRKHFDTMLKQQLMKRQEVSEHIFNGMKECAHGKDCKFHCPYSECRYHTLLQLLGSHIPTYGVMRIAENMDFEHHDTLVFITRETEEELQLVLCNTRTDRRSSIYLLDVRKHQLTDALFLLTRYLESSQQQKRKLLAKNMHRFGRPFGILLCRIFRK